MKLYLVTGTEMYLAPGDTVESARTASKWVGTQADAAAEKKRMKSVGIGNPDVKDIDVPTDKQGLLRFLNEGKTS
jgi:hypothetical protein